MATADTVLRGGLVVDGTGAPPVRADVAIDGERIVAVGEGLDGRRVIDASGCVVAPGFIDIHTHYDPQATWDPWVTPSGNLGVTSVVAGNCGFSVAPCRPEMRELMMRTLEAVEDMSYATLDAAIPWTFETYPEYLDALRCNGLGVNVGGYIGHTAVRMWVMGEAAYERQATSDEVDEMRSVVREAVLGGALGFSTDRAGFVNGDGGRPVPSFVGDQAEAEALCMAVAEAGRGIVHVAPGDDIEWVYPMQQRLGRTVTWSAILAYADDLKRPLDWREKLARHERGRATGARVFAQVTSRPLTFQFTMRNPLTFYQYPAFSTLGRTGAPDREDLFRDPAWREQARSETSGGTVGWHRMEFAETDQADVAGRTIAEVAAARGVSEVDAMVDVALADGLGTRFRVTMANGDPDNVTRLLTGDGCVLGLSDAGAHIGQLCDAVLPLDFLSRWVRDRGLMSVEDGVRKVSGELADVLGLDGRGYVRAGGYADLVVLDWDALAPGEARRVRDLPGGGERLLPEEPTGLRHVLVNGQPVRLDGEARHDGRLPGKVLTST